MQIFYISKIDWLKKAIEANDFASVKNDVEQPISDEKQVQPIFSMQNPAFESVLGVEQSESSKICEENITHVTHEWKVLLEPKNFVKILILALLVLALAASIFLHQVSLFFSFDLDYVKENTAMNHTRIAIKLF
jgi:hypothetical protein